MIELGIETIRIVAEAFIYACVTIIALAGLIISGLTIYYTRKRKPRGK